MKFRTKKKQLNQLWAATSHSEYTETERFSSACKTISGKRMRKLIARHYNELDKYVNGWTFPDRPYFNSKRRYYIDAVSCYRDGECVYGEHLYISRANDKHVKACHEYLEEGEDE